MSFYNQLKAKLLQAKECSYNILVPKFLRDFDIYLLRNYPVVWRTKAVFVFYYGVVASILLFGAGFLYAFYTTYYIVDGQHLIVDPIKPIEMGYDTYHLWSAFFVSIGIFYWAYKQYQFGFSFTKLKDTLLTLLLYVACFWFLFGILTPAFRWGTIYKTAYHWINNADLDGLKKSGIYPYGFLLLPEYKAPLAESSFLTSDSIFKEICEIEDTLIEHLYTRESTFWINWLIQHQLRDELGYYQSQELTEWNRLYNSYQLNNSYQLYKSEQSYLSCILNQFNRLDESFEPDDSYSSDLFHLSYLTDLNDLLYGSDLRERSYLSSRTEFSYLSNLSYLLAYNQYKFKTIQEIDNLYNQYKFKNIQDSTRIQPIDSDDSLTIYRPSLPYVVEKAIRSVTHAQLYWHECIYLRHWQLISSYILMLSLLFFFIPFLLLRHLFVVIVFCMMSTVITAFLIEHEQIDSIIRDTVNGGYLIVPSLSCFWIAIAACKKQQLRGFTFAIQGLFTGLLFILIGSLFIIYRTKFHFNQLTNYQAPYNLAFYGVQILGIIGAMLTTYVRTLPKQ